VPEPKSAFRPAVEPMLEIQAAECESTGSFDTSACQNELAGVIGHEGAPGTELPCATAAGTIATTASRSVRVIRGPTTVSA
jgi:hypothetical protein